MTRKNNPCNRFGCIQVWSKLRKQGNYTKLNSRNSQENHKAEGVDIIHVCHKELHNCNARENNYFFFLNLELDSLSDILFIYSVVSYGTA